MMDHQGAHYTGHQLLHAGYFWALIGTRCVRLETVVVQRESPIDGTCGKDQGAGGSDVVGRVARIGRIGVIYGMCCAEYL